MQVLPYLSVLSGCCDYCHLPGVREMEGEAVQGILPLSHVLLQPQAEKRSLFGGCHRGLQMLQLTGCRAQERSASLLGGMGRGGGGNGGVCLQMPR